MDTLTNSEIHVRLGQITHVLVENRFYTRCKISDVEVVGHLLVYPNDANVTDLVNCMACLVDRQTVMADDFAKFMKWMNRHDRR